MAFPTDWLRKQKITIDNTKVSGSGSHTDFTTLITLDHLNSEIVDAGSNSALNGGGDVRFSSDSAGVTQLSCEIVNFVTNATPGSRKCEIWVKVPSVSTSVDTDIYIWYSKAGETQPAASASFGSESVWTNEELVLHFANKAAASVIDSAGNHTVTDHGSPSAGDDDGITFDGTDDYFSVPDAAGLDFSSALSVRAFCPDMSGPTFYNILVKPASTGWSTPYRAYGLLGNDGNNLEGAVSSSGSRFGLPIGTSNINTGTVAHHVAMTFSGTDSRVFVDGTKEATDTSSGTIMNSAQDLVIGVRSAVSTGEWLSDKLRTIMLRGTNVSDDWIATESNNQKTPSTFATAGTPEDGAAAAQPSYFDGNDMITTQLITRQGIGYRTFRSKPTAGATTALLTGVTATGSVGTLTVQTDASFALTGVTSTGSAGTVTALPETIAALTGVEGTGQAGDVAVQTDADVPLTGVEGTSAAGTVTVQTDADVPITGVEGTSAAGTVTVSTASTTTVPLTGVEGTGAVGAVTIQTDADVPLTGVEGTGQAGTVTVDVSGSAIATPTGVEATGSVGTVAIVSTPEIILSGVTATGGAGDVTIVTATNATLTGVTATGSAGVLAVATDAIFSITGVEGTGQVGTVVIPQGTNVTITGVSATGQVGIVSLSITGTWAIQDENDGIWTLKPEDGAVWSEQVKDSGTWNDQTEDNGDWTEQTEDDGTWTKQ